MLENQKIRPAQVIGPLGEPLTLDSLPPASTTRWVVRRKAEVVAAAAAGRRTFLLADEPGLGKTAQANERGVELVVSQDSRLDDGLLPEALPSRDLVTILGNLIDNAVDAAQGGVRSRVTVSAYTESVPPDGAEGSGPGGCALVLRVSDTGAGVDPAHADLLFQRGFTTKPADEGGRGLGLALVRQAVRRRGGALTVTEAEGGGACFEVRLPLSAAAPSVTAAGGPGAGGAV